jgi:hypothetical protein
MYPRCASLSALWVSQHRNALTQARKAGRTLYSEAVPMRSFKAENRWISGPYFAAAIAICVGSSMISAWAPALDHRHLTYFRPSRFTKRLHGLQGRSDHPAQSPHATSCPQICRMRSGTSMTKSSTNCYLQSLPSRSNGERSSPLRFPVSGASKWSLPSL